MVEKKYELETIKQITEVVNKENLKGFIMDFEAWLRIGIKLKDNKILKHDFETFRWNDDGDWGNLKEVTIKVKL